LDGSHQRNPSATARARRSVRSSPLSTPPRATGRPSLRPPICWRRCRFRSSSGRSRGCIPCFARRRSRRPEHCALSDAASNGPRGLWTGRMTRRDCAGPVVASAAAGFPFFSLGPSPWR
jgi:hypothetical protein